MGAVEFNTHIHKQIYIYLYIKMQVCKSDFMLFCNILKSYVKHPVVLCRNVTD
jgi:hypothetical protein